MQALTIRISDKSRKTLKELASREGASVQSILEKAIELYRRQRFLEEVNQAYAALSENEQAWVEVKEERRQYEASLEDGLDSREYWNDEGTADENDAAELK